MDVLKQEHFNGEKMYAYIYEQQECISECIHFRLLRWTLFTDWSDASWRNCFIYLFIYLFYIYCFVLPYYCTFQNNFASPYNLDIFYGIYYSFLFYLILSLQTQFCLCLAHTHCILETTIKLDSDSDSNTTLCVCVALCRTWRGWSWSAPPSWTACSPSTPAGPSRTPCSLPSSWSSPPTSAACARPRRGRTCTAGWAAGLMLELILFFIYRFISGHIAH